MKPRTFDSYPWWMALIGISVTLGTYAIGAYILAGFGPLASVPYLGFCAFAELSTLRGSCIHCFYYGKLCGLGRGRLCPLLFRRGDPKRFVQREVSVRDVVPDILVSAVPVIGGIVLLVRQFSWVVLLAILSMVALAFVGNALVRGSIACRHCAQRELGCPAERFFTKQAM